MTVTSHNLELGLFLFLVNRLSLCMEEFHKSPVFIVTQNREICIKCFEIKDAYHSVDSNKLKQKSAKANSSNVKVHF